MVLTELDLEWLQRRSQFIPFQPDAAQFCNQLQLSSRVRSRPSFSRRSKSARACSSGYSSLIGQAPPTALEAWRQLLPAPRSYRSRWVGKLKLRVSSSSSFQRSSRRDGGGCAGVVAVVGNASPIGLILSHSSPRKQMIQDMYLGGRNALHNHAKRSTGLTNRSY